MVVARIEDPSLWRHHPGIQASNRHLWLDGRARRIQAAQHAVEQRAVDGIVQCGVLFEADAGDKQVGVETRFADHGQHLAAGRVEGDHRTAPIPQCGFGRLLQFDVEAEDDVFPGNRVGVLEHP